MDSPMVLSCLRQLLVRERKKSSVRDSFHTFMRLQGHNSIEVWTKIVSVFDMYTTIFVTRCDVFSQKWRNWNTQKTMQYKSKSIKKFLPRRSRRLSSFAANIVFWFDYISLLFKAASLRHIAALFQAHIQLIWPLFLTLWCKFGKQ